VFPEESGQENLKTDMKEFEQHEAWSDFISKNFGAAAANSTTSISPPRRPAGRRLAIRRTTARFKNYVRWVSPSSFTVQSR